MLRRARRFSILPVALALACASTPAEILADARSVQAESERAFTAWHGARLAHARLLADRGEADAAEGVFREAEATRARWDAAMTDLTAAQAAAGAALSLGRNPDVARVARAADRVHALLREIGAI